MADKQLRELERRCESTGSTEDRLRYLTAHDRTYRTSRLRDEMPLQFMQMNYPILVELENMRRNLPHLMEAIAKGLERRRPIPLLKYKTPPYFHSLRNDGTIRCFRYDCGISPGGNSDETIDKFVSDLELPQILEVMSNLKKYLTKESLETRVEGTK